MVLGRDVATARAGLDAGLVLSPVTKLQFVGVRTGSKREELAAKTDSQDRTSPFHCFLNRGYGFQAHLRIARTIGNHDSVVLFIQEIAVIGNSDYGDIAIKKLAENAVFATAIDDYNPEPSSIVDDSLTCADFRYQFLLFGSFSSIGRSLNSILASTLP